MSTKEAASSKEGDRVETRVVLLVATPLGNSLNWSLRQLGADIESRARPIDWTSKTISSLPEIQHNMCFARHMAVAVLDIAVWTDPTITLLDKFRKARYWEHLGSSSTCKKASSGRPGSGREWDDESIISIKAVQYIGEISHTDDVISRDCEYWNNPARSYEEFQLSPWNRI